MDVELLGELALGLELLHQLGHLGPDRDALQGDDVAFAASPSGRKKSARQMRSCLGWRGKTRRSSSTLGVLGVEDDQLVAVGVAGEVAEPGPRVEVVLLAPHPLEARREALLLAVALDELAARPRPSCPRPPQCSLNSTWRSRWGKTSSRSTSISRAPQNGGSGIGASVRAAERTLSSVTGGASSTTTGFSRSCLRLGPDPLDQRLAGLAVDQRVHRVEPGEGVLAVEDAGLVDLVGLLALRVEGAAAEVAVDRGAADQHRERRARAGAARRCRSASASRSRRAAPRGRSRRPRCSTAASMIVSTGTCLPRSITV